MINKRISISEKEVEIVKTKKEDFPKIAEIYSKEFSKPPYNESWNKETALNKLNLLKKYCDIYSVFYNEQLVGFFAINMNKFIPGEVAEGEEFAIKSDYQNKGLGGFCLNWIEKMLKEKNYKTFLFISSRNKKQCGFYNKRNYKEDNKGVLLSKKLK